MTDPKKQRAEFVKDAAAVFEDMRVRIFGNFQNEEVRARFDRLARKFAATMWDEAIEAAAVDMFERIERGARKNDIDAGRI